MALDFVILVNDGGELIPIARSEMVNYPISPLLTELDSALNAILDARAIDKGEYEPADNNVPILVAAEPQDG